MRPGPPRIELAALRREFPASDGPLAVLRGIDLVIEPGEFVSITGRSGCGKSTLLAVLSSLDRDYRGSCRVGGLELRALGDREVAALRRRVFGYVFQDYGLIPVLTCRENVALPALYEGRSAGDRARTVDALLARFGLGHRADRYPETLSGGERQRIAVARALVNDAPVIVADEPTGALDSENAELVMDALGALHREGRTVVLVTHAPDLAERAERIVTLADGALVGERRRARPVAVPAARGGASPSDPGPGGRAVAGRMLDAARMVLRAIARRRLQSALTVLGIAIGAASVISLATVGDGARRQVVERIEALGSDLVTVSRGPPGVRGGERVVTTLIAADAAALQGLPGVRAIAPEIDGVLVVKYRERDFMVTVTGTSEQFPEARDWAPTAGAFFGASAVERHAQVAVLGATTARSLFGDAPPPIGDYLLLGHAPYRLVGVMEAKGVTTGPGHDRDNQIWVPHTTASARLFARPYIERIVVKVDRGADLPALVAEIRARVLARHGREDFSVNTLADVIRAATSAQRTLDYFLSAIAGIALLVGGVGVMNIMLASVHERVREIGLRMAVGAARRDIRQQFLSEAVVLCLCGGCLGVLLGVATVHLVSLWGGIPATLTAPSIAWAVASAIAIGLAFGVGPAWRAAAVEPAISFRSAA